jgi:hypothetical protein
MKTRNALFFSAIILFLIGLGYLRDHLFVHVNTRSINFFTTAASITGCHPI